MIVSLGIMTSLRVMRRAQPLLLSACITYPNHRHCKSHYLRPPLLSSELIRYLIGSQINIMIPFLKAFSSWVPILNFGMPVAINSITICGVLVG